MIEAEFQEKARFFNNYISEKIVELSEFPHHKKFIDNIIKERSDVSLNLNYLEHLRILEGLCNVLSLVVAEEEQAQAIYTQMSGLYEMGYGLLKRRFGDAVPEAEHTKLKRLTAVQEDFLLDLDVLQTFFKQRLESCLLYFDEQERAILKQEEKKCQGNVTLIPIPVQQKPQAAASFRSGFVNNLSTEMIELKTIKEYENPTFSSSLKPRF